MDVKVDRVIEVGNYLVYIYFPIPATTAYLCEILCAGGKIAS